VSIGVFWVLLYTVDDNIELSVKFFTRDSSGRNLLFGRCSGLGLEVCLTMFEKLRLGAGGTGVGF
jgi:hypothetical protein